MITPRLLAALILSASGVSAACPYMQGDSQDVPSYHPPLRRASATPTDEFLAKYEIDDTNVTLTSDVGGPISDQNSLKAGERGPTLLEDFIFRQKVCCLLSLGLLSMIDKIR